MRIKQIELNGFKSFMERTVLELPPGVTAIVGPNGCGKSNVVDAIRWVLGEQSPKHLRGASMEDVIFNGNASQGPLGMAEVSLLLERDESDLLQAAENPEDVGEGLPPELAQASEVLVTRRYFRSGESEYFINRAPCRLKDITELFLGTGVGTKAYSIIEQGRVDQLINAKPEELRLFIEEAAGTTRFRSRKIAAERKMERTRENLVRVQDVLHELERQMASLERQARRAEEYRRLKTELRDLDLRVMAVRHRLWVDDAARLEERTLALRNDEDDAQEAIRRAQGTSTDLRSTRAAHEERRRATEAEITEQRLAVADAQARRSNALARQQELETRARDGEREAEQLRGRLAMLQEEAATLGVEVDRLALDEPAATAEQDAAEQRRQELEAAGSPLTLAIEAAKDELLDGLGEAARLRNLAQALGQRRQEIEGRRRKLEDEQRVLGERLHANARESEAAKLTLADLEKTARDIDGERAALAEAQASLAGREAAQAVAVERVRREQTQLRSRAESLRELQARYEGCSRGASSLLAREGADAALLASMLRVPLELERAVAVALGTRLAQVVLPDTSTAVGAIEWLSAAGGGSATVIPREAERRAAVIVPAGRRLLDQIEVDAQHWALAEAILGHVLLADDLQSALAVWRGADHPVTVVTLAGEAIDALGAVSGGSEPPVEESLLARQRELRELEATLESGARTLASEEEALARVRADVVATAEGLASAAERVQSLRIQIVTAEKDRERLDEDRARIAAELEVCALEAGGVAGEDGEVSGELVALEQRLAEAEQAAAERRNTLAARQEALARWREDYAEAERSRTAAAVRAAAVRERLRGARADFARSQAAVSDLEERLTSALNQTAAAAGALATASSEATEAESTRAAAEARTLTLTEEREALTRAILEADALLAADDESERAGRERLEQVREERTRNEVALAERRMTLEHLATQLAERYELPITALADVPPDEGGSPDERAAHVEALRARLMRLGEVNPTAIEELAELRERRDFLATQRSDLERSLEDLRRTISKLARTSRERFDATFEAANEKLAEVFPKLFPGGKARLDLTEPGEDGEAGVEIVVQPGGKKLQSLSLLSGGEKALTAVGLILSLFLIRPTPFCLLDEVDAPLDEANIGRFNQLVRDMASTSQFVLITHNRRTMEVADTLYGITMEQAGVSKVVAVRLREAA